MSSMNTMSEKQSIQDFLSNMIHENIQTQQQLLQTPCLTQIERAFLLLQQCFMRKNKVLSCGNGGSAGDAQHFAAEMMNRFEQERYPLPAIALNTDGTLLTAISNDYAYEQVFAKQIQALGLPGDVLIAITTSGNSPNVLAGIQMAKNRQMHVIVLTGQHGGKIQSEHMLQGDDVCICVPHTRTARIQESHLLIIHSLCALIDKAVVQDKVLCVI
jgi:D-sedoheptulose 7-phosphate isomerase